LVRVLFGRLRSFLVEPGCEAALFHFFLFLLKLSKSDLLLLPPLDFGILLLSLLNVESGRVMLLILVDHHILLRNQEIGSLFVVEFLDQLVICFFETLRAFNGIS